jgi:hypothetical protein
VVTSKLPRATWNENLLGTLDDNEVNGKTESLLPVREDHIYLPGSELSSLSISSRKTKLKQKKKDSFSTYRHLPFLFNAPCPRRCDDDDLNDFCSI